MADAPYRAFLTWPLAAAAIVCFTSGVMILETATGEPADVAAGALVTIGAMCMGAWLFALGVAHHTGRDDLPPPRPPPPDELE